MNLLKNVLRLAFITILFFIYSFVNAATVANLDTTENIMYISKTDQNIDELYKDRVFKKGDKFDFKLSNDKQYRKGKIDKIQGDSVYIQYRSTYNQTAETNLSAYAIKDIHKIRRKGQLRLPIIFGAIFSILITLIPLLVGALALGGVVFLVSIFGATQEQLNTMTRQLRLLFIGLCDSLIGAGVSLIGGITSLIVPPYFKIGKRWRIEKLKRNLSIQKESE